MNDPLYLQYAPRAGEGDYSKVLDDLPAETKAIIAKWCKKERERMAALRRRVDEAREKIRIRSC